MDELVSAMQQSGALRTPRIIDAFRATDRARFLPDAVRHRAYGDEPLPLGELQTVSQPSTVAFMLELLDAQPGNTVLDVGSGSGWTTALLAHLVGPTGRVLGIERIDQLVEFGRANIASLMLPQATIEHAGTELGAPKQAPFDRILVSAAADTFPDELMSQLAERGTMVLPVGHTLLRVVRVEHQPIIDRYEGYVFVPLIRG